MTTTPSPTTVTSPSTTIPTTSTAPTPSPTISKATVPPTTTEQACEQTMFNVDYNDNIDVYNRQSDGNEYPLSPYIFNKEGEIGDETVIPRDVKLVRILSVHFKNVLPEPVVNRVQVNIKPVNGAPADVVQTVKIVTLDDQKHYVVSHFNNI